MAKVPDNGTEFQSKSSAWHKEISEALSKEEAIQNDISNILQKRVSLSRQEQQSRSELIRDLTKSAGQLKSIESIEKSIHALNQKIGSAKNKELGIGDAQNKGYIKQLSTIKDIYNVQLKKLESERKSQEITSQATKTIDGLLEAVESLPGGSIISKLMGTDDLKEKLGEDIKHKLNDVWSNNATAGSKSFSSIATIGKSTFKFLAANPLLLLIAGLATAIESFEEIIKESQDFSRDTGISINQAKQLTNQYRELGNEVTDVGADYKDTIAAGNELVNTFKNTSQFTEENVVNVVKYNKLLGTSVANASKLELVFNTMGMSAKDAFKTTLLADNLAKAAKVPIGRVIEDISKNSEVAYKFFAGSPEKLIESAVAAQRLGLSLQDIGKTAEQIMDIQSSLEDQMTTQVMLGRQFNLDKARELAYVGDLKGAQEEIMKQVGSEADFNKMNVIAREQLAKTVGMSVDQLAEAIKKEEAIKHASKATREEYEKAQQALRQNSSLTADQILQQETSNLQAEKLQASWSQLVESLKSTLLPLGQTLLEALEPIADLFNMLGTGIKLVKEGIDYITTKLGPISTFIKESFRISAAIGTMGMSEVHNLSKLTKHTEVHDAVISPKGDVVTTHPDDFLLATKNPEKLANNVSGGGMDVSALITKIDQLISVVNQPVHLYLDNKIVSVMDNQLTMRRHVTAGFDNTGGKTIFNRS